MTLVVYAGRLLDIVHADAKLYLVFEFLDVDLKRYIENGNRSGTPLSLDLTKVSRFVYCHSSSDSSFPLPWLLSPYHLWTRAP